MKNKDKIVDIIIDIGLTICVGGLFIYGILFIGIF